MQGRVAHAADRHQSAVLLFGEPSAQPFSLLVGQYYRVVALASLFAFLGDKGALHQLRCQLSWEWINLHIVVKKLRGWVREVEPFTTSGSISRTPMRKKHRFTLCLFYAFS